ncbi:MAG: hypothetical protein Fur003_4130 [Candidatus Dojkabacteria bacterium]
MKRSTRFNKSLLPLGLMVAYGLAGCINLADYIKERAFTKAPFCEIGPEGLIANFTEASFPDDLQGDSIHTLDFALDPQSLAAMQEMGGICTIPLNAGITFQMVGTGIKLEVIDPSNGSRQIESLDGVFTIYTHDNQVIQAYISPRDEETPYQPPIMRTTLDESGDQQNFPTNSISN